MGFHRKWVTVTIGFAIQLFYIHYRKYFAVILNSAVYLSSARVSMFHTLVPLQLVSTCKCEIITCLNAIEIRF